MEKKAIAIITARGGSKRIPRKNIKEFCGKPIIEYSIRAAIDSGIFQEVMVSTDDDEIAEIARKAGAKVPFMRSEFTSGDYATTRDVLMEVLGEYQKRGENFDYMVCIYPTAPFVTAAKLCQAFQILREKDCTQVIPVVRFSFPPQRAFVIEDGEFLKYKWEEHRNSRSQDLEPFYHDAGQFYFYDVKRYLACEGNVSDGVYPIVLPESEVQDIDTEEDWEMAEFKYKFMQKCLDNMK